MVELVIFLFLIGGFGLILWAISGQFTYTISRVKLPEALGRPVKRRSIHTWLEKVFPFSRKLLEKFKLDKPMKDKLDAAHLHLSVEEFFNLKLLLITGFCFLTFLFVSQSGPWILLVGVTLGYILPDLYLKRKIGQRKYAIARLLPETVDLLGLCVEAGLDFTTAVRWVVEKVPNNPLIEELGFVLEEIKWGKSRIQALRDMSRRLNISEVSSFVQTLVQADRMGTPVAEAFGILSEDTRLQRFHRGERIAMQAPIKILFPLIFCILPVIGIVIGGPIFLQFMEGGLLKGLGK
ncbi:MAG: type II secretion system F family protein [Candidatus Omnitrophica bacterium]|nr:type II secretion system F family protein [Candidatus Omnitrophota bacterium]